jgi:hypothetical protein
MAVSTIQNASLASGVPSASNITTGTLAIANGGTGTTQAPTFFAFKPAAAGNQSITSGVPTIVTFGATTWNVGNCYSTSTSRFTPTVAGYYQLNVSIGPNLALSVGSSANIYISKNGDLADQDNYAGYRYFPPTSSSSNFIFGTSVMMYLNGTTDYVVVYFDQGSVLAGDGSGGSDRTYFQAFLARSA